MSWNTGTAIWFHHLHCQLPSSLLGMQVTLQSSGSFVLVAWFLSLPSKCQKWSWPILYWRVRLLGMVCLLAEADWSKTGEKKLGRKGNPVRLLEISGTHVCTFKWHTKRMYLLGLGPQHTALQVAWLSVLGLRVAVCPAWWFLSWGMNRGCLPCSLHLAGYAMHSNQGYHIP